MEPVEGVRMRDLRGSEVQEVLLDLGYQTLHELLQGKPGQGMCFFFFFHLGKRGRRKRVHEF